MLKLVDDAAIADFHDAFRVFQHVGVVRGKNERGVFDAVQFRHQFQNFLAGFGIEVRGRLVGSHEVGVRDERPRDGDALPLPAGKLIGAVFDIFLQPDFRNQFFGAVAEVFF